jgi:hypothetical protein
MLESHKIALALVYYKPSDDDSLIEDQKAINNLTINGLNKLKTQVAKLEIEKSRIDDLDAIQKLEWKHVELDSLLSISSFHVYWGYFFF